MVPMRVPPFPNSYELRSAAPMSFPMHKQYSKRIALSVCAGTHFDGGSMCISCTRPELAMHNGITGCIAHTATRVIFVMNDKEKNHGDHERSLAASIYRFDQIAEGARRDVRYVSLECASHACALQKDNGYLITRKNICVTPGASITRVRSSAIGAARSPNRRTPDPNSIGTRSR